MWLTDTWPGRIVTTVLIIGVVLAGGYAADQVGIDAQSVRAE
jgi:hypothetical protein